MRQQHFECDPVAARVRTGELRKDPYDWQLQVHAARFKEKHAGRGGRDCLGYGSEVEECFRLYFGRIKFISEVPECFVRDELSAMRNRNRCTGKGALRNGGCQFRKRATKLLPLVVQ